MIIGAHSIVYSKDPEADRAFLRDVLKLSNVDVGGGWLIFGLPPSELAVHPSEDEDEQELYLMCDDAEAFVAEMEGHEIVCGPLQDLEWGLLTRLTLPGGGHLGVYEPRHPRPPAANEPAKRAQKRPAKKRAKAPVKTKAKAPAKAKAKAKGPVKTKAKASKKKASKARKR